MTGPWRHKHNPFHRKVRYYDPSIKAFYVMFKLSQISSFQPVLLYRLHNRHNEISHCEHECLIFAIHGVCLKIIVEISNQMHPAFLLFACDGVIAGIKV